ncbi:MAG: Asp-tRNA(Asn)/Glu-tRNA(Gln) amidotransferase GatCAB subunit A, partial [Methanobacterium sp.]
MKLLDKSKLIKNHEITALDNLELFCKNIQRNNGSYNAFLETNKSSAMECAEDIDARIKNGGKVGKLAGLVIG